MARKTSQPGAKGQKRRLDQLGTLQRKVMEILWKRGPEGEATVAEVREALARSTGQRAKTPAYTTVLSVLQKLTASGWVTHRQEGRTYVYRSARSREEAGATSVRTFVDSVFRGDPMAVFQTLLEDETLDSEQLARLANLIEEARRREQEGGGGARR